uniref:UDP-N-acetylglucosamine transporter-like n=1 Tax=Phallusia mammillata TaxID=59560 RepID=A0A6F9DST1_9ASCI|nr:UDP-N-acetylglucosamine transporter-like [Phallusia mammillata]
MSTSTAKYVALCLLVLQNSLMILMLRFSRKVPTNGPRYVSTSVVFLSETLKFTTSLVVIFCQSNYNFKKFFHDIHGATLGRPFDFFKIAVPSGIYAVQNNLLFIALSYLDAATFQISYQLKILTTALFSVLLLKKSLSSVQWGSLVFLMIGVAMVQFPTDADAKTDIVWSNHLFGLFVILIACMSSGFAGVYFELLLKQQTFSLWVRNLQMGGFGIIFAGIQMCWNDGEAVSKYGILQGYNSAVVMVLLLQAYGGLLVAYVIQFTDNIIKGFATSLAIIVSYFLSYLMLDDLHPTLLFTCGAAIVVMSTFLYGQNGQRVKSN